jgi:hypothetical protein
MKRNLFFISIVVAIIIAGAAFAQQERNRGGSGTPPSGPQSVLTGTVVSFTASAGSGMPALVIQQNGANVTLVLGPFWFLQNAKFAAAAGDTVEATVITCADCPNGYAVVAVKNFTNGTSVTLRDSEGLPLWISNGPQGGGNGCDMRGNRVPGSGLANRLFGTCNGEGPDMTKRETFSGQVKSFAGGPGVGRPTLVLATAEGDKTFIVGPYRVIRDSGMEFEAGAALTLTAAPSANGEWVAITIKDDATGAELTLRDATTGRPSGGCRGRRS